MLRTPNRSRRQLIAYWMVVAGIPVLASFVALALYDAYSTHWSPLARAKDLNRTAWISAFVERGLAVPKHGPREGYWGSRLGNKVFHPTLAWWEPTRRWDHFFQFDARGLQHFRADKPRQTVLVVGASVAAGAYASEERTTYFAVLGRSLERRQIPTHIVVTASGAWKSSQEVRAAHIYATEFKPDLIVLLNGLNDLTIGENAETLHWARAGAGPDAMWEKSPNHDGKFEARVRNYQANVLKAISIAKNTGAILLVVLQPSLTERTEPTRLEQIIRDRTLATVGPLHELQASYQAIRQWLTVQAEAGSLLFFDASRMFNGEAETMFTDLWHFPDPGHELLGETMARVIAPLLRVRTSETKK